jgi:lambda family phage portal protein
MATRTLPRSTRPARSSGRGPVSPVKNSVAFEAGAVNSRRTFGWRPQTTTPNGVLSSLATLRDRSRSAVRNNAYGKEAIDKLVSNIVGTGIKPLSKAFDVAFAKQLTDLWERWTDESDADGLLDFYGQQAQVVRTWKEAGEVFVRLRPRLASDGLSVPLQIQVVEPELCPYSQYLTVPTNGNKVKAGIEFNGIGQRVAYWFFQSRPGDIDDADFSQLRRVPADNVIHVYDPLRAGQLRGIPQLTSVLIRLNELEKMDDVTMLRQQLANMFVAFLKRQPGQGDAEAIHPLTGAPLSQVGDRPTLTLEPGIFQELDPGESLEWSEPPSPPDTYPAFMRQQLQAVAAGVGVPYEVLTGDMANVNDRVVRVILHEFRRRVSTWQHNIIAFQFCRRVWKAWMDRVFVSGALPIPIAFLENSEPWARVKWMPQGWPYLHPVQDVEADEKAIRDGFTSRSAVVSERGEDAATIDEENAADNARADAMKLKYDSDGRQAKNTAAKPVLEAVPA